MSFPSGVGLPDMSNCLPILQAGITRLQLGGYNATPGLLPTLNRALGAINDMISSNGNVALYTTQDFASFQAALQTLAQMAQAANDGPTSDACNYAAGVFNTL